MAWTERQRAMLAEMGLRVYAPAPPGPACGAELAVAERRPAEPPSARPRIAAAIRAAAGPRIAAAARACAGAGADPDACRAAARGGRYRRRVARLGGAARAVAGCRACGLCEARRNTVFGVGNAHAQWMIVGEAPGEQEDLRGEPFVGAAGQLLDSMLRALGLTRAEAPPERQVFIANTLKCRPPRNRNPEPAELAQCEPFLQRQIALVQPRIIVAMGRFAVQSLLRSSEPIGRLRGREHRYQGVPLVVTYHPAYLLRNLVDKARAWDDLCLAAELFARGEAS